MRNGYRAAVLRYGIIPPQEKCDGRDTSGPITCNFRSAREKRYDSRYGGVCKDHPARPR